jgi:uncharacterized membrane protein YagU involved in acid resistance
MAHFWKRRTRAQDVFKGIAAGAIGGLVASWTMSRFQSVWSKAAEAAANGNSRKSNGREQGQEEDPTIKTAETLTQTFTGSRLNKKQKEMAGPIVHYAFGAAMGALYGAAAEFAPPVKSLVGVPYGAALFVGADEVALPLLGLSKKPTAYPASRHIYGLSSHFVYGVTLEGVRRLVRERL